jgi:hypothetical protein
LNNYETEVNFFELENHMQNMTQKEMVEKINSMNLTWKAAEYEQFEGLSNDEIHKMMKNGYMKLTKKSSYKLLIFLLIYYNIIFYYISLIFLSYLI